MSKDSPFRRLVDKIRSPSRKRTSIKSENTPPPPTKSKPVAVVPDSSENRQIRMGKSNKFDYTNRANSGAKLGQIIGSSLQKEAEKVKKDAERHLQKVRKQSTDSVGGCSDNLTTTHIIDLKAPYKELGDEGVCALADGLEIALKEDSNVASLALEDLNLSGNKMTTLSLARLAPIIELAKYDIKTLNLSGNTIKVETDEQAQQWEAFLRAFSRCLRLRRLDLSSNQELGTRAMEVLARVHVLEPMIQPMNPGGDASVLSLDSDIKDGESMRRDGTAAASHGSGDAFGPTMANARMIKRRCGLRSIPYITLHDIGLTDSGALWLSYIVEDHHYPNQLIDELNATHSESLIKTYQQDTDSHGIDWTENKTLGKDGKQLLDRTESFRRQMMFDDKISLLRLAIEEESNDSTAHDGQHGRQSLDRRHSRALPGNRRVSIRSIHTDDGGEHEATELDSARRKLQRFVISHDTPQSVELWDVALKVFRISRVLLYLSPTTRKRYTGEPLFTVPVLNIPTQITVEPPSPTDSAVNEPTTQLTIDTAKASYAAKVAGSPESALTEVTNTPNTPLLLQKRTTRKGAFSEGTDAQTATTKGTDMQTVTDKLNVMIVRDSDPKRFVRYQQNRIALAEHGFRDRIAPCHLPSDVIQRIIRLTIAKREMEVLSEAQMQAAVERGQRRETLMVEREWLRKDESAQIWKLLDSIKCLAYGE